MVRSSRATVYASLHQVLQRGADNHDFFIFIPLRSASAKINKNLPMPMIRFVLSLQLLLVMSLAPLGAQRAVPAVQVRTLDGESVNLQAYVGQGRPVIISLWATWCKPCLEELDNIAELYPEWQETYGLQLLAISVDDQRQLAKVGPLVSTRRWAYTILTDPAQQLKTALNYQLIPQLYLLNGAGEVVYEHTSYVPGNEFELEEKLRALFGK